MKNQDDKNTVRNQTTLTKRPTYHLTYLEYVICDSQGRLFEYCNNIGLDFDVFVKEYMCSDFCARAMDAEYSRYHYCDTEEVFEFLEAELSKTKAGLSLKSAAAYWIGFMYRMVSLKTGISSKLLYSVLPPQKMELFYPGMHVLDDCVACEELTKYTREGKTYAG